MDIPYLLAQNIDLFSRTVRNLVVAMTSNKPTMLIGDIGGTNARFALASQDASGFTDCIKLKCADYESASDGIQDYLSQAGAGSPDIICLAVAAPIVDQSADFTNNHWHIMADELASRFGARSTKLINDFEAVSCSLPLIDPVDLLQIGGPEFTYPNERDFTMGVIGPGTGLGMAGLAKRSGYVFPIPGEASHSGFAPESQEQIDLLLSLRTRYNRVSCENIVSGTGLENIYWAAHQGDPAQYSEKSVGDIFTAAINGSDPKASFAVDQFFEILGQIAGNLALFMNARDGIFIAGGIVKRYPELFAASKFRRGFENKGKHRSLMEQIPTQLIMHADPGLIGASYYARNMVKSRA